MSPQRKAIAFWLAVGAAGFLAIPWYALQDSILSSAWLRNYSARENAPALLQGLRHGRVWLVRTHVSKPEREAWNAAFGASGEQPATLMYAPGPHSALSVPIGSRRRTCRSTRRIHDPTSRASHAE